MLDCTGLTKLFRRDATNLGPLKRFEPFDLIFLDPPYNQGLGELALTSALKGGWIKENALIVLEESKNAEIKWPSEITSMDTRAFGDTNVHFARN